MLLILILFHFHCLKVEGSSARLMRRKATKKDAGEYKVTLSNEAGSITETFTVTVKGILFIFGSKHELAIIAKNFLQKIKEI